MKSTSTWCVRLAQIVLGVTLVIGFMALRGTKAGNGPIHLSTDWSHRHLIFSAPKTLLQSLRMAGNERFALQWVRRNAQRNIDPTAWRGHHQPEDLLKGDWSMNLGTGATVGAGNYPAKFSFDATTAKCATDPNPDYVVYNTSLAGSATSIAAKQTGTFTGEPTAARTITITNGANTLVLTAGTAAGHTGGATSGRGTFARSANTTTQAADLAAGINFANNGSHVGVSATSAGAVVTITATTTGTAGNSITITNGLNRFTLTGTSLAGGSAPQANIMAFDNLYTGCSGTHPTPYWAYNTGGTVVTSPAISFDGTQVAFVQNVGTTASLVLVKWAASGSADFDNPTTLTTQASATAYRTCTAPCMYTMAFTGTGTLTDTNSSPFVDFDHDTIYVGDDGDHLQKFTGVFDGTPTHVTTGGFPTAALTAGDVASSPVFDATSGKVFIADGVPAGMGNGWLHSVNANTGAVITSAELSRGVGFADGPIVDPVNEMVYLFTADNTGSTCPGVGNAVISIPTSFTAAMDGVHTIVSTGNTCSSTLSIYDGDFDNAYFSGNAGHLYVCSNIGGAPTLFQVAVSATGVLGTVTAGPALAASGNSCGPVTEMYNPNASGGAKDWIFTNVEGAAVTTAPINCPAASGCVMSFDVTSGAAISPAGTTTVGAESETGGTSGIVFDNSVATGTLGGTSQVYFTPLGNQTCTTSTGTGGCAIQASQSGLD